MIKSKYVYDFIVMKLTLVELCAISSIIHLKVKYHININKVAKIEIDQES